MWTHPGARRSPTAAHVEIKPKTKFAQVKKKSFQKSWTFVPSRRAKTAGTQKRPAPETDRAGQLALRRVFRRNCGMVELLRNSMNATAVGVMGASRSVTISN